jgi:hypothetical protein
VFDDGVVDCDGNCYNDLDFDEICDENDDCIGSYDCANNCNGSAIEDCAGTCDGTAVEDECGVCDGPGAIYECGCDGYITCWDDSEVCESSECPDVPFENPTLWISHVDVDDVEDVVIEGGCDLPDNSIYLLDGSVLYNVDTDIGGFQLEVDGTLISASGGDAAEYLDSVSFNANTGVILGFSFTGAVVPAGCGTLIVLETEGDVSLASFVFSDSLGGSIDVDYYDPNAGVANTGTIEISLFNDEPVAGFQFTIVSSLEDFALTSATGSGGTAADSSFTVSASPDGIVLGFSFQGATIPASF